VPVETSVGATRRFFGCCAVPDSASLQSSFSASLAVRISRFPNTLLLVLVVLAAPPVGPADMGVCGGVVRGSAEGWAECVAVTSGTDPSVGVGLLNIAVLCNVDCCVATELAELDRVGLAGRAWDVLGAAGPADPVLFDGAWWLVLTGDGRCVGVGRGVMVADE
jgi:hypothetical protein